MRSRCCSMGNLQAALFCEWPCSEGGQIVNGNLLAGSVRYARWARTALFELYNRSDRRMHDPFPSSAQTNGMSMTRSFTRSFVEKTGRKEQSK